MSIINVKLIIDTNKSYDENRCKYEISKDGNIVDKLSFEELSEVNQFLEYMKEITKDSLESSYN